MLRTTLIAMSALAACGSTAFADADSEAMRAFGFYGSGGWSYVGRCHLWRIIYVENSSGQPETFTKRPSGEPYYHERISKVQSLPGNKLAFETEDLTPPNMRRYYVYEKVGDGMRVFELSDPVTGRVAIRNGRDVDDGKERPYERCS